jgi:hypothetical protein
MLDVNAKVALQGGKQHLGSCQNEIWPPMGFICEFQWASSTSMDRSGPNLPNLEISIYIRVYIYLYIYVYICIYMHVCAYGDRSPCYCIKGFGGDPSHCGSLDAERGADGPRELHFHWLGMNTGRKASVL